MKQFLNIFLFELKGYLKNKLFIGITIFLIIAMAVAMFIPNIIAAAKSGSEEDKSAVMLLSSVRPEVLQLAAPYFGEAFENYAVTPTDATEDEIKEMIIKGEAECAFVFGSLSSYTYYVKNLSMYDTNTAVADAVLTEVNRIYAMTASGLSPEQAQAIMSVQIESSVSPLGKDQMKNFFYTYIMIFALYMVILLYGQMVATNVAAEKSSRAMELLITSTKPVNLIFGKVLASCSAGFMQLVALFGSAVILFNINKQALGGNIIMQSIFGIPIGLLFYMLAFFVLGFLIYAFLYGALGSVTSKPEDVNTCTMPVTFLFIIAFFVVIFSMTSGNIDNMAMLICSYIPFTSPIAMFTRIAMSTVAWYEIFISVSILVFSVVAVGFIAAKIYRTGVLLYGKRPKLGEILKTVFKKQDTK